MNTQTETHTRGSFNELVAIATRLLTQAEAVAALVARLELDAGNEYGDPEVRAQLDRVVDVLGAREAGADLDERERSIVIGHVITMLHQALELVETPGRAGGWVYTDPAII